MDSGAIAGATAGAADTVSTRGAPDATSASADAPTATAKTVRVSKAQVTEWRQLLQKRGLDAEAVAATVTAPPPVPRQLLERVPSVTRNTVQRRYVSATRHPWPQQPQMITQAGAQPQPLLTRYLAVARAGQWPPSCPLSQSCLDVAAVRLTVGMLLVPLLTSSRCCDGCPSRCLLAHLRTAIAIVTGMLTF